MILKKPPVLLHQRQSNMKVIPSVAAFSPDAAMMEIYDIFCDGHGIILSLCSESSAGTGGGAEGAGDHRSSITFPSYSSSAVISRVSPARRREEPVFSVLSAFLAGSTR